MYSVFEALLKLYNCNAKKVSDATGIATSTFTDWKAGRYTPKIDKLQKIADYFGVSVNYLMTGENSEKESVEGNKYYFNDETAKAAQEMFENQDLRVLFSAARDAKPEDLQAIYGVLMALKKKENNHE